MGKWEQLEANLRVCPQLVSTGNRLDYRVLWQLYRSRRAVIRETDEVVGPRTIFGFVACRPTALLEWGEVSTACIAPEKSGNGLLGEMLKELLAATAPGTKLFAFSDSEAFIAAACREGFYVASASVDVGLDVILWAESLGIRDRLPKSLGGDNENSNRHVLIRL